MQEHLQTDHVIDLGEASVLTLGIPWAPAFEELMGEDYRD